MVWRFINSTTWYYQKWIISVCWCTYFYWERLWVRVLETWWRLDTNRGLEKNFQSLQRDYRKSIWMENGQNISNWAVRWSLNIWKEPAKLELLYWVFFVGFSLLVFVRMFRVSKFAFRSSWLWLYFLVPIHIILHLK